MDERRTTTLAELMAKHIKEAARIKEDLRTATTPQERRKIGDRERFNSYLLALLVRLETGEIKTAPA